MDVFVLLYRTDGTCWRMTHLAKKTDTPGRFTFHSHSECRPHTNTETTQTTAFSCKISPSSAWNNDNDMRFVDVVYDNYALVYTIKTKEETTEVLVKLYSKLPPPPGPDGEKLSDNLVEESRCSCSAFQVALLRSATTCS